MIPITAPAPPAATGGRSAGLAGGRPAPAPLAGPEPPLLRLIAAEYREMPGLSLTAAQGARLWGVDEKTCLAALRALEAAGRLRCAGGRYRDARSLERVARAAR